jgi:hypothetical protein
MERPLSPHSLSAGEPSTLVVVEETMLVPKRKSSGTSNEVVILICILCLLFKSNDKIEDLRHPSKRDAAFPPFF